MRFKALISTTIILLISVNLLSADNADESNWQLQVTATGGGISDLNNFIGVSPEGLAQYDKNDVPEPPGANEFISLYFPHPDWGIKAGNYTRDIRELIITSQKWTFEVNTNLTSTDIKISWQNLASLVPPSYRLTLKDVDGNKTLNMRNVGSYTYNSGASGGIRHFELLLETPNDIPSMKILEPGRIADITHGSYIIRWKDEDTDSDATISLYYADDTNFNGTLIVSGISEDDETDSYQWIIPNELKGTDRGFYIYAKIEDETNPSVYVYSSGRLAVMANEVSGSVSGIWKAEDSPVVVKGDIKVEAGNTLTIDPGVIVKFAGYSRFNVNGILQSQGTADKKIIFTSIKDDEHGGDTNGDGNVSGASANDWKGIFFGDTADNANSVVEHTQVLYANYPITIYGNYLNALGVDNSYSANETNKIKVNADTVTADATLIAQGVPYETTGSITVRGQDGVDGITTLTLSPGIIFEFAQNSQFLIGSNDQNKPGALVAGGTAEKPIIFTTNQITKTSGYWNGLYFHNFSSDTICALSYCVVEYAGHNQNANIYFNNASPTIANCTIQYGSGYGIYCNDGSSPAISSSTFSNNVNYPIAIYGNFVASLGTGNTFSENAKNAVKVFGDTITTDSVWKNQSVPYVISGNIVIDGGSQIATLTMNSGVSLKFTGDTYLQVGGNNETDRAALKADGSMDKIIFTSSKDDDVGGDTNNDGPSVGVPGDWKGIYFYDYSDDATTKLVNCEIRYAGASNGNLYIAYASPTIQGCTVSNSSKHGIYCVNGSSPNLIGNTITYNNSYGIYANGTADSPVVKDNAINNNGTYPLRIGANAVKNVTGNTFSGNTKNGILVFSDTITEDATWTHQGVPFVIDGSITVNGGDFLATLTISPNTILKFSDRDWLTVGGDSPNKKGALVADGTDGKITFTSFKDDSAGGDTNAEGDSEGNPGDWYGIYFHKYSDDATCKLVNCELRYGGYNGNSEIYLNSASPTIQSCMISSSSKYGIYCYNNSDPVISENTIKNNNSYGIYAHKADDDPIISNNSFMNNGNYPIRIGADAVKGLSGNSFSDNAKDAIYVFGEKIMSDGVWKNQNVPYVITGNVTIDGGSHVATLTLTAGVILKFEGQRQLIVGGNQSNNKGALIADGTDGAILFTSFKDDDAGGDTNADGNATQPAQGDWYGIYFKNYSDDTICKLINCEIRYGGHGGNADIYLTSASPLIKDSIISHSSHFGIYCYNGSSPQIQGNTIKNNANRGVYADDAQDDPIVADNTFKDNNHYAIRIGANAIKNITGNAFSDNKKNAIEVWGETITEDATWTHQGAPYVITNDVTIDGGSKVATLTLDPGVILKFNNNRSLTVGGETVNDKGALVANGTAEKKVVFTSYRDDSYGGDTNTDGESVGVPGDWYGVIFKDFSDDSKCALNYCEMKYGGRSKWGIVYFQRASGKINHCTIKESQYYGIRFTDSSNPTITESNIADNLSYGLRIDSSTPTFSKCVIADNSSNGIYLASASIAVSESTISGNDNYGIYVSSSSPTVTKCIINNSNRSGIYCTSDSDPVISETEISNNGNYGIYADDGASQPIVTDSTISGNGLYAAGMPAEALTKMMEGDNTFPENSGVEVRGGTISTSGSWSNDVVYGITSNVTVDSGVTLTISPGTIIKFDDNRRLTVKGTLKAVGKASEMIIFTSVRDTMPSKPDKIQITAEGHNWEYLYFNDASIDSVLDYTIIKHAETGIYCSKSSPTIIHNLISNTTENGIYCDNGARPVINYNNIINNAGYGVRNNDGSVLVNARNNWWGDASGPSGSGPGSGDKISQHVDFEPWLTNPFKGKEPGLTSPNGGENWKGGSSQGITWNSPENPNVDHIKILYSTDGGNTYPNIITDSTEDTGTFLWNVPAIDSKTVRVKMVAEDIVNQTLFEDSSDNDFTIDSTAPIVFSLDSSVGSDTDESYKVGDLVRIVVTESSHETELSGTITVTSQTDDPGINSADLTDAGDGTYYYDWDTSLRKVANDYQVETTLEDAAGNKDSDGLPITPDLTIILAPSTGPFQYTMTSTAVYFHGTAKIFDVDVEVGDAIGAFVPSVSVNDGCVGAISVTIPGQYGALAVYGNDPSTEDLKEGADSGDRVYFKIWDASENRIYEAVPEGPDEPIWTSNNATKNVNLVSYGAQKIPLREGWNLISFSVNKCFYEGEKPNVSMPGGVQKVDVVNQLGRESIRDWFSYVLFPNNPNWTGSAWQRVTSFDRDGAHLMDVDVPSSINTLKYMSVGYGYWIKLKEGTGGGFLSIEGKRIAADAVLPLEADWNLMGYLPSYTCYYDANTPLCQFPSDVTDFKKVSVPVTNTVLASIMGKFRRLTSFDCKGAHIFDMELPSEANTLHYIGPGYGYWIKTYETADLTYPSENEVSTIAKADADRISQSNASTITIGPFAFAKTPTSCSFFATKESSSFVQIDGVDVSVGDVIGVFASEVTVNDGCIGAFEVTHAGAYGALAAYGDDPTTSERDGASPNTLLTFKIWSKADDSVWYAVPTGPDSPTWEDKSLKEVGLEVSSGISADISGIKKNAFLKEEKIYGHATLGLSTNTTYDIYVVENIGGWTDGMDIPTRIPGSITTFTTDSAGDMPDGTLLFANPTMGQYDIVIDVDGDGKFKRAVDYLDSDEKVGFVSLSELTLGDVSGNGTITAYDSSLVLNSVANLIELTSEQKIVADVDCNGRITAHDASLILKFVVDLIHSFPCELTSS